MKSPLGSSICVQTQKEEIYFYGIKLPCGPDPRFAAIFHRAMDAAQAPEGFYLPDQHDTLHMLGYVNNETGNYVAAPSMCVTLNHFFGDSFSAKPPAVSQLREQLRMAVRERLNSMPDEELIQRFQSLTGEACTVEPLSSYQEKNIREDSRRAYAMNSSILPKIYHPSAVDVDSRVFWPGNDKTFRELALAKLDNWDKFLDQVLDECIMRDGAGILVHREATRFVQEQMDAAKDDPALEKERIIREAVGKLKAWSERYGNPVTAVPVTFGREDFMTLSGIRMPLTALSKHKGAVDLSALAHYARSEVIDFLFKDTEISPYLLDPPIANIVEIGDPYDPIYKDEDFFVRKQEYELKSGRLHIPSVDERLKEAGERACQHQAVAPEKELVRKGAGYEY